MKWITFYGFCFQFLAQALVTHTFLRLTHTVTYNLAHWYEQTMDGQVKVFERDFDTNLERKLVFGRQMARMLNYNLAPLKSETESVWVCSAMINVHSDYSYCYFGNSYYLLIPPTIIVSLLYCFSPHMYSQCIDCSFHMFGSKFQSKNYRFLDFFIQQNYC